MATRKNTFLVRRSNVAGNVPAAGQLLLGELALNTADVKLYTSGTTTNSILPIGWDRIARTGDTMTGSFSAPTISATTYYNLPKDVFVTGGTYNSGTASFVNSTGGTFTITGFSSGAVTSIATNGPITGGTITSTGTIGITKSNTSTDGYLSSIDWNTFNDKQPAITGGTVGQLLSKNTSTDLDFTWIDNYTSQLKHTVKADVIINKGQAVYVTSANGTNMIVGLASNTSEATSSKTLGLLAQTLGVNGVGFVITEGLLSGLDTSTATAGDPVWLGTNGNLIFGLVNKPYAPAHLVFIGIVTRVNANNGEIFVKVQNGFELNEIHDVDLITTTPVNGHILGYNGTLWVNKTIASWLGYTPTNANGTTNYVSKFTGANTLGNSLIFDNGTNVGIGTTTPTAKLELGGQTGPTASPISFRFSNDYSNGETADKSKLFLYNIGGTEIYGIGIGQLADMQYHSGGASNTNARHNFYTANNLRMTILNSGNVGIGTTTPTAKLEVRTDSGGAFSNSYLRVTAGAEGAYGGTAHFEGAYNDYGNVGQTNIIGKITTNTDVISATDVGGNMRFFTKATGGTYATAPIERMRITNSGNVNIGGNYTSTNNTLQVTGNVSIGTTTAAPTNGLLVQGAATFYSSVHALGYTGYRVDGGVGLEVNGGDLGPSSYIAKFNDYSNNTRAVITGNGNVGIGTTSPNAKVEIKGPHITTPASVVKHFKALDLSLGTNAYYGGFAEFWIGRYSDTGNHAKTSLTISLNDGLYESNTNADKDVMTLLANGNVGIGTTNPTKLLTVAGDALINDLTIGRGSGNNITNTVVGFEALNSNTSGVENVAVGYNGMFSNTTGVNNAAVGTYAMWSNTIGAFNAALGQNALYGNTTGGYNIAIGQESGRLITNGSTNTVTNNSIFIGANTRASSSSQTNQIVIGDSAIGNGSNTTTIGHTTITNTYIRGNINGNAKLLLATVSNATVDTDKFLTLDGTEVKYRTGAELLSDIGGQPAGSYLTGTKVDSFNTRTGAVTLIGSDVTTALGYTPYNTTNPNGYTTNTGTVTSVGAITLGVSGTDLSSTVANGGTTPVITLNIPTASAANRGALNSTDWSTFNGKQAQLNGTGFVKAVGTTISYDNTSYLPLAGGTMSGQILFQTSALNNGFRWDVNSDAAGITFKNTGDGDSNSYFNFFTEDNGNEYFKFSHNTWNLGSFDYMDIKNGIVRTNGDIYVNAAQSGIRSSGTNELISGNRVWHSGDFSSTNVSNWNTAFGWGNHASAGYVPTSRTITINGTTLDLSANRSFTIPTYTLATSTVAGLVELFSDTVQSVEANAVSATASRTYGVQLNSAGQAVVNVPWVDTTNAGTVTSVTTTNGTGISTSVSNATTTPNITITNTAPNVTTDISITHATSTVTVNSSDGADGIINAATSSTAGVMTNSDKVKLEGIAAGAQVNVATDLSIGVSSGTQVRVDSSTGADILLPVASSTLAGVVTTTDWSTFNGKQAQLNGTGFVKVVGTTISYDNSSYYLASNPNGYTNNTGTVTSVNTGNGMNFTNFSTTGTITLGTPSSLTLSSTNALTTNSHTHAFAPGGTTGQYITGAGTLVTFPTIPTVNDGTLTMATSGIATGSASFTANQAGGSTFTVNVPATNLTYSTATTTGTVNSSTGTNATIPAATTSLAGLMTNSDKVKLDGIAAGAQVNVATNLTATAGSTSGPTINSSTGSGVVIPSASATASGVITTDTQTIAGVKTFSSTITGNISGRADSETLATVTSRGSVASGSIGVPAGDGNGYKFWNSDSYKISMGVGSLYQYGSVTDYSIKTQMDAGNTGRGFTWGRQDVAPIAAINATSGNMAIAGEFTTNNAIISNQQTTSFGVGTTTVFAKAIGGNTAYFLDYVATSGTNARAGTMMVVVNGSSVEFTEVSTNDIGNTSALTLNVVINSSNINLNATSISGTWSVKVLARIL